MNLNATSDPGLVYNMRMEENAIFLCAMGYSSAQISGITKVPITCPATSSTSIMLDLNLPSITIPSLKDDVLVKRTVTNVGKKSKEAIYEARFAPPLGVNMSVIPQAVSFNETTSELTFQVRFWVAQEQQKQGFYTFGSLTWIDGFHSARIPISVRTTLSDDDYGNVLWEGNHFFRAEDAHPPS